MAYEYRRHVYNLSGSLQSAVNATDTTITAANGLFTSLPTDLSTSLYTPLVLADDTAGKSEVVYAVAHGSGSAALTVVRGREGTSPQTFPAGSVVRDSVTARDLITSMSKAVADALTDAHLGMQVIDPATGKSLFKTLLQGFQPVGLTVPGTAMGRAVTTNAAAPANAVPQVQAFNINGLTEVGGYLAGALPGGAYSTALVACVGQVFSKGSDAAVAFCKFNSCTAVKLQAPENANGPNINFSVHNAAGNLVGTGVQTNIDVIAIGY